MPPISILIKPASSLCNMKCKYCFYADVADNREVRSFGLMSEDTLEALVKKVFEYATESATFSFQGGEPTLVGIEYYKRLIELQKKYNAKKIKVHNSIQTNGYVIDDEWSRFFAENKFLVGLSMDGNSDLHNYMRIDQRGEGTYNKVKRATELFKRHGVQFNILCVVNNYVANKPQAVYNALKKYRYIQFIACLDSFDLEKKDFSLTNERYKNFLVSTFNEYYKDFRSGNYVSVRNFDNYISILMGNQPENCANRGICTCYFVVEGDGGVYPCDFYVLDEWKLGNVNSDGFDNMLDSDTAKSFVETSKNRPDACKDCRYKSLCRGGCRRECEPITSEKLSKNAYCDAYKGFFDECIDKMCDMAERINFMNRRGV